MNFLKFARSTDDSSPVTNLKGCAIKNIHVENRLGDNLTYSGDALGELNQSPKFTLFLITFAILFFELTCIRWFGSSVIFLTFFTNLTLMACFLGISVGCLSASKTRNYLLWCIPLTLLAILSAIITLWVYNTYSQVSIDVGNQASPQQIYFGTEYRVQDPSRIVIPLEVIAGFFFLLIAMIFVGLGQAMGRAFNRISNRIEAYSLDVLGSICGIVAFGVASYLQTPPMVWFGISLAVILFLLWPALRVAAAVRSATQVIAAIAAILLVSGLLEKSPPGKSTFWSPYYRIDYTNIPQHQTITTNNIGHQTMLSQQKGGSAYALPHLLNRDAGRPRFKDVLIIGAGSGNDVQAALSFGAEHVDAVEIDPVIQRIGKDYHPDNPYKDPRITVHFDDGRSFVKKTQQKYDLVIYALVDSLVLHSGYSSLRLESFLFTQQAFEDVKRVLKPSGLFAMYNFYRQGWVVGRLTKMSTEVFGSPPVVVSLPYQERIEASKSNPFITFILAGDNRAISQKFGESGAFWLNDHPLLNKSINGYASSPPTSVNSRKTAISSVTQMRGSSTGVYESADPLWRKIAPSVVDISQVSMVPTDDWPFLYLLSRSIPDLNLRGMAVIAVLSIAFLLLLVPQKTGKLNWQMVFLGAGFMLLETKGVVHMALLFGSTWIVNSIVFAAVLTMILASNLFVQKFNPRSTGIFYALLIVALLINILVPLSIYLALPGAWKVIVSCIVVFAPVFFAGVVFATVFRDSKQPDVDLGSNIAGIVLGGLSEYLSLVLGFNTLLVFAIVLYMLSLLLKPKMLPLST